MVTHHSVHPGGAERLFSTPHTDPHQQYPYNPTELSQISQTSIRNFLEYSEELPVADEFYSSAFDHPTAEHRGLTSDWFTDHFIQFIRLSFLSREASNDLSRLYSEIPHCLKYALKVGDTDLEGFVVELLAVLVWIHFEQVRLACEAATEQFGFGLVPDDFIGRNAVDEVLCKVYNVLVEKEKEKSGDDRKNVLPDLSKPSVYHDPKEFETLLVTKNAGMHRKEDTDENEGFLHLLTTSVGKAGVDRLSRANRWSVLRLIMHRISERLPRSCEACQKSVLDLVDSLASPPPETQQKPDVKKPDANGKRVLSHRHALLLGSDIDRRLVQRGFARNTITEKIQPVPSAPVSRQIMDTGFLLDLLDQLYLLLFSPTPAFRTRSSHLVDAILIQATTQFQSPVILLAKAIQSRAKDVLAKPSGKPSYLVPPIGALDDDLRSDLTTGGLIRLRKLIPPVVVPEVAPVEEKKAVLEGSKGEGEVVTQGDVKEGLPQVEPSPRDMDRVEDESFLQQHPHDPLDTSKDRKP